MPLRRSVRAAAAPACASTTRYDWGRLARFHVLDDRQYRDAPGLPAPRPRRRLEHVLLGLRGAARPDAAARRGAGALARRGLEQRAALEPARAADADGARCRGAIRPSVAGGSSGPTAGTATRWRGAACSRASQHGARQLVVLGGDVHANFVADLKLDFDDAASPVIATEFCGTSITSEGMAQSRIDAALPVQPAHPPRPRRRARQHALHARRTRAARRAARRRAAARCGERRAHRGALRRRGRPGRRAARLIELALQTKHPFALSLSKGSARTD